MLRRLPESLDFIQQAVRKTRLEGSCPIAELERLRDLVSDTSGELVAELEFGRTLGFYSLKGKVEANLELVCQRCLEPMAYPVSGRFSFALLSDEAEEDELPATLEPYLVEGEEQSIISLLEDELLLSLPLAATHPDECSEVLRKQVRQQQEDREKSSPFAVLKNLKTD